ncbi:response regulator [Noviherbaspirillum aridicola]|uniref:Hpt domain-containing protein n=1 Tax=Noviherbaspirillum aridicola TaxID=2849687 RepID=A0ABQ4Q9X9_9BURK|nr:response regulator [Noviherbaspirillum aridicola]GIZ53859.1 hypothetical protein NCCP691_38730 [Noviherbaspirillum aridicola]
MDSRPASPRLRLLIADDNAVSRMIAAGLAEKLGHAADMAADGEQALRMLAERHYDLVLMDCEMPRLDGYAATRRLRALEGNMRHTPVVALTAALGEEERLSCLEAGMDDFLCKPLSLTGLEEVLARRSPAAADTRGTSETDGLEAVARHLGNRHPELATLWLDDCPHRLDALRSAVADGDVMGAARAAHALAGACASIGAREVSAQCQEMERQARGGHAAGLADRLARIEAGCAEVAARLRQMLQSSVQS